MSAHTTNGGGAPPPQGPQPVFDPSAKHHAAPKVRPIRAFGAKQGEQTLLGLADAQQISSKIVFTQQAVQAVLPLMDGSRGLGAIVSEVGRGLTEPMLQQIIAQLDDAGLLEGPKFDAIRATMESEYETRPALPPGVTGQIADMLAKRDLMGPAPAAGAEGAAAQAPEIPEAKILAKGPESLSAQMDKWMDESLKDAESPSFDSLPKAVIAPHLDYGRGWLNYGHAYGRLRVVDRPGRVVILGTNHFGRATGVASCDKGFETPLGTSPFDEVFAGLVGRELGAEGARRLLVDRFDHEREHSIELHVAWVQKVFGADDSGAHVPVYAALVHDPSRNNGESYDGKGLALQPFIDALKTAIAQAPGPTLVVCSADLSHVGLEFGDKTPAFVPDEHKAASQVKAFREKVIAHDREMLQHISDRKPAELTAAIAWQQNPTRWCSVGAIAATMLATEPDRVDMLQYGGVADPRSGAMVTSMAAALF